MIDEKGRTDGRTDIIFPLFMHFVQRTHNDTEFIGVLYAPTECYKMSHTPLRVQKHKFT